MATQSLSVSSPTSTSFRLGGISRRAWSDQLLNLLLISGIASLAFTGLAGALRWAFPAFAFVVAVMFLITDRFGRYVTFCVWLFLLSPVLRRLVDFQVGWEPVNTLLLAPYAAAGLSTSAIMVAVTDLSDRALGRAAFLVVISSATYALILAVINERILGGAYDYLRWVVPPCFAMLIAWNWERLEELKMDLSACLTLALPLVGIYGIYQFFAIPSWDAHWMQNVGMQSIGEPEPLKVRVFSTMHSPGSLSAFLMTGITLLLVSQTPLRWIGLALGIAAMALTMSRTAWLGLACVGFVLSLIAPLKTRMAVLTFAAAVLLLTPIVVITPELTHMLEVRLGTFSELAIDDSYQDRAAAYAEFIDRLGENLLGGGLAISGALASNISRVELVYIDGGPIEVFLALGPIVGFIYYVGVISLGWRGLRANGRSISDKSLLAACKAIIITTLLLQVSITTTVGEIGFFNWLAFGLALAVAARDRFTIMPSDRRNAMNAR